MMQSRNGHEVDFNYFIQFTIQKKMPWKSLSLFLIDLAPTLEKSKEVIEILVQELELWVSKAENYQDKDFEASNDNKRDTKIIDNSEKMIVLMIFKPMIQNLKKNLDTLKNTQIFYQKSI